jgi:DNA-binding transcriptional LysR family regulator
MVCMCIMHTAHDELAGIDLNLLTALDALVTERHVTRAAGRLGITQSAASHALARLRELLGDPLLVRGARGAMVPTERALALGAIVRRALDEVAAALRPPPAFDPLTARRTFNLGTGDFAELTMLPELVGRLANLAPGVDLFVRTVPTDVAGALAAGELDAVISPAHNHELGRGCYQRALFDDGFVVAMRDGHPAGGLPLTLDRFCALDHLLVAPGGTPGGYVDVALAALGRRRRVALAVPHFLIVPHLLATTDLIVTLASRIAAAFVDSHQLVLMRPPVEVPGFTIHVIWHEYAHADPAHRWLREQLVAVAAEMPTVTAPSRGGRRGARGEA